MEKYSQRAEVSWFTVGTYLFLMGIIGVLWLIRAFTEYDLIALWLLLGIYLARMLSIHYDLDEDHLSVRRLFGSRSVKLSSIHKADPTSLRDISPVSWTGGWGWRSRMWSPTVGSFDNLSTVHNGLMIYADGVPFLISPLDRDAFRKNLDERCGNRLSTT